MNPETVATLSYTLVEMQKEAGAGDLCVIGRDTRPSGPRLEEAAVAGALDAGATVLRLGVAPTPAILKTAQNLNAASAVSLTASHNPAKDNGWKGTLGSDKPVGPQVKDIDNRYWSIVEGGLAIPTQAPNIPERPDLLENYKQAVVRNIEEEFGERPLEGKLLVVDAANGAAMNITPDVLRRLGATIEEFACDGLGLINKATGANDLSGLKKFLESRPDIVQNPNFVGAVANDGDADRMIGLGARVLPNGQMVFEEMEGNRVMELQAQGQPGIVGTDYTNDALIERLRAAGIGFEFCENGDANVTAALRKKQAEGQNWSRGGEFTGHHIDLNWLSSGDGVRMAAWLAAYAATKGTFFELAQAMPLWPQVSEKIEVPKTEAERLLILQAVADVIADARQELAATGGRNITRPSGTEPIIRVWSCAPDERLAKAATQKIAAAIINLT
jgi:phosphoglucosamine mutase